MLRGYVNMPDRKGVLGYHLGMTGFAIDNGIRRYLFIVIDILYVQRKQSTIVTSKFQALTQSDRGYVRWR